MNIEEEIAVRNAINNKKIDISVTKIRIEDIEVAIGLVAKRDLLKTQYDELEDLYRSLAAGGP